MIPYYIAVSPSAGVSIGFVSIGENPSHALAELSRSLRMANKIFTAHIEEGPDMNKSIFESKLDRNIEIIRTIRKPGRKCFVGESSFRIRFEYPKVTVKEVTTAISASYVNEVWLGGQ